MTHLALAANLRQHERPSLADREIQRRAKQYLVEARRRKKAGIQYARPIF
jgi:hypothetical protein